VKQKLTKYCQHKNNEDDYKTSQACFALKNQQLWWYEVAWLKWEYMNCVESTKSLAFKVQKLCITYFEKKYYIIKHFQNTVALQLVWEKILEIILY
jgi:hypothetical protein